MDLIEVRDLHGDLLDYWQLSKRRYGMAGVGHRGEHYFAGGRVLVPFGSNTDRVDIFTAGGNRRQETLPFPTFLASAGAAGDIVIVAGGTPPIGAAHANIQIFNTVTKQWSVRPIPMGNQAIDFDDRWIVISVKLSPTGPGTVEIYDSWNDSWQTLDQADIPQNAQVGIIDDSAYFVGFQPPDNQRIRVLSLETHEWSTLPSPSEQTGAYVGVSKNFLVRGFGLYPIDPTLNFRLLDLFDVKTGEWRRVVYDEPVCCREVVNDRDLGATLFYGGVLDSGQESDRVDVVRASDHLEQAVCFNNVVNSTGSIAEFTAYGFRNTEIDLVTLQATGTLPFSPGVFLLAPSTIARLPVAGAAGELCVGGGLGRLRPNGGGADAFGTMCAPLPLTGLPFATPITVMPGDTWYFQAWYRDWQGGGIGSILTDAVSVRFE